MTYRLYDYGRPRELHLADGAEVANAVPFPRSQRSFLDPACSTIVLETPNFSLEHIASGDDNSPKNRSDTKLVIPTKGVVNVGGATIAAGECALVAGDTGVAPTPGSRALIARPR